MCSENILCIGLIPYPTKRFSIKIANFLVAGEYAHAPQVNNYF